MLILYKWRRKILLKINIEEGYFDNENIGYSIDNKFFKLENKSDFTQISENYLPVIFEKKYINENIFQLVEKVIKISGLV